MNRVNGVYVELDAALKNRLTARARNQKRTQSEQVKRYLEFAMLAEDNPHLPIQFINGILQNIDDLKDEPSEVNSNIADGANAGERSAETNPVPR